MTIQYPDHIPTMVIKAEFTIYAKVLNITGGIGFLIACGYFFHHQRKNPGTDNLVFGIHCLLFGMAGLIFELSTLWDATWWWWHVIRFFAYSILLVVFSVILKETVLHFPQNLVKHKELIITLLFVIFINIAFAAVCHTNISMSKSQAVAINGYGQTLSNHLVQQEQNIYVYIVLFFFLTILFYTKYYRSIISRVRVEQELIRSEKKLKALVLLKSQSLNELEQIKTSLYDISRKSHNCHSDIEFLNSILDDLAIVHGATVLIGELIDEDSQQVEKFLWSEQQPLNASDQTVDELISHLQAQFTQVESINVIDGRAIQSHALTAGTNIDIGFLSRIEYKNKKLNIYTFLDRVDKLTAETLNNAQYINSQLTQIFQKIYANMELQQHAQQLKHYNEELKQANILANESINMKNEFIAVMSHEIRTPLNGMIGYAQILQTAGLDKDQNAMLDTLSEAGTNLLHVLNSVLDYSKLEAGKIELDITSFDVRKLIYNIKQVHHKAATDENITVNVYVNDSIQMIRSDFIRLKQVLDNLLSNAIKFTKLDGAIDIKVDFDVDDANMLRFEVVDDGVGIPNDKLESVFESYSQADSSTTRKYGGTGLGLAICRKLIHLLDGKIGVESNLNEGTTFWFTIPYESANEAPCDVELKVKSLSLDELQAKTRGKHLLIVDDVEINIEILKRLLEPLNFEITTASDGQQACEFAAKQDFALILMDCLMPIMDGYQATHQIRKLNPGVPIIAVTANQESEVSKNCSECGMNAVISKPYTKQTIYQAINQWL